MKNIIAMRKTLVLPLHTNHQLAEFAARQVLPTTRTRKVYCGNEDAMPLLRTALNLSKLEGCNENWY